MRWCVRGCVCACVGGCVLPCIPYLSIVTNNLDMPQRLRCLHQRLQMLQQRLILASVVCDREAPLPKPHLNVQDCTRPLSSCAPAAPASSLPPPRPRIRPRTLPQGLIECANPCTYGRLATRSARISLLLLLASQGCGSLRCAGGGSASCSGHASMCRGVGVAGTRE